MARPITRFHWVYQAGSIKKRTLVKRRLCTNSPRVTRLNGFTRFTSLTASLNRFTCITSFTLLNRFTAHVSTTSSTTRDSSAILVLHGKLGKASAVHWYKPLSLPRFIRLCKTRQTAVWPRLPATGNVSFTVLPRWFYWEHMQCQFYWQSVSQAPICSSIHIHPPSSPSHIGSHRPTCTLFTGVLNLRQNGSRKRTETFRK